jgi:hypothetical protein
MCLFFRHAALYFSAALTLALGTACNAAPHAAHPQQLMIKFKPATYSCDGPGIARFAGSSSVALEFVRPMSGDACVVRHAAPDTHDLPHALGLLRKHPAVQWAEPDALVKNP